MQQSYAPFWVHMILMLQARDANTTSEALDLPQVIYYTLDQFLTSSSRPSARIGFTTTNGLTCRNYSRIFEYRRFNTSNLYMKRHIHHLILHNALKKMQHLRVSTGITKVSSDHLGIIPTMTPKNSKEKS